MLKIFVKHIALAMIAALSFAYTASIWAQEVTVGYQRVLNPWKVAIQDGTFEKRTGYKIDWRQFDSGGAVINAMASGDVQIAMAGSSPIAAGISRGLPIQVFWIMEDIAAAEALVVRDGSGIAAPQDLKGKRIAVPFVSTTHFHVLFALEQFGISSRQVSLRNLQPPQIAAAWNRGDIDAAFVWDPALAEIKKTGKVLVTSGQLSTWGKATFDGTVVNRNFAAQNEKFMTEFVKVLDESTAAYRDNPSGWNSNPANAKKVSALAGGQPNQVEGTLALYGFPSAADQATSAWLGGGENGGVARAIKFTAEFLKEQRQVDATPSGYAQFVNSKFVEAAAR